MRSRSTRIPRLALRASVLAALALPTGIPSLMAETTLFQGAPVEVLGRSTTRIPGGTVTFIRIRPPVVPPRPADPAPAPATPLSPAMQAAIEREEAKPYSMLSITATVYTRADGGVAVTELTWREGDKQYRAWSTADFRLLRQFNEISLETHRFQWMPFIDAMPLAEVPANQQPDGLQLFSTTQEPNNALPEYYFEGSQEDADAAAPTLAALDWLHAHYYLHKEELAADLARREVAAAEQARKAAEDAAKPQEHTVFFWKIK